MAKFQINYKPMYFVTESLEIKKGYLKYWGYRYGKFHRVNRDWVTDFTDTKKRTLKDNILSWGSTKKSAINHLEKEHKSLLARLTKQSQELTKAIRKEVKMLNRIESIK